MHPRNLSYCQFLPVVLCSLGGGKGGQRLTVAAAVTLETSGCVEGLVGDETIVGLHDHGVLQCEVCAAVFVRLDVAGIRGHEIAAACVVHVARGFQGF